MSPFHNLFVNHNSFRNTRDVLRNVRAYLGSVNLRDGSSVIRIEFFKAVSHPSYDTDSLENDIALLYTKTNMITSGGGRVDAAIIPQYKQVFKDFGIVSGYGSVDRYESTTGKLYYVHLQIVKDSMCLKFDYFDSISQMCLQHIKRGKESCSGDSGGPFTQKLPNGKFILIGLVSFGHDIPCGMSKKTVEVHTRVSSFVPWILSYVNLDYINYQNTTKSQ